jgi:hypothetical protein
MVPLHFVTCSNDFGVLSGHLLASPCLASGRYPVTVCMNRSSAAEAFNPLMGNGSDAEWLVWVHHDVYLPEGWDEQFIAAISSSRKRFQDLAVVGVYGISGTGTHACRAGHLLDRGTVLKEAATLPCSVDSLDELLFAVRRTTGLLLDETLGFDFYATDLVLHAKASGWQSVVVDAYCEHWSSTPSSGNIAPAVLERIAKSAKVFERKWAQHFPITTPCFDIAREGDVARFISSLAPKSLT